MHPSSSLAVAALLLACSPEDSSVPGPASQEVQVAVTSSIRHQEIAGFGTCLVSWDSGMASWYQKPEAVAAYVDYLGFNILRTNLWGDGTIGPKSEARLISHKDPAFASQDPRTPVFLDFAKRAMALGADLRVIGTVWSPPAWMKRSGKITDTASGAIDGTSYILERDGKKIETDNRVHRRFYPHFSAWLAEMALHYQAKGVPLYAVSAANEPQFTQSFESCVWTAEDLALITAYTARALRERGLGSIKLFGPETMTGFNWENGPNIQYTKAFRANLEALQALGFWATHGYSDGVQGDVSTNSSAKFWSLIAKDRKPYWVTEGGTGGHDGAEPLSAKGVGMAIHNALVAGNASAFVPWQFAEDSRSEHNLMPLAGPSLKTEVVRHYSRFIPRGWRRLEASPSYGPLWVSAFGDGAQRTVVLLNTSSQPVRAVLGADLPIMKGWTTSPTRRFVPLPPVQSGSAVDVPGPGVVTLTTLDIPKEKLALPAGLRPS